MINKKYKLYTEDKMQYVFYSRALLRNGEKAYTL